MAIAMVFAYMPTTALADASADPTKSTETVFADMPSEGFWSTAALKAAVVNNLLKGFTEGDGTYIKPDESLTRAQMAAIINRAFGAIKTTDLLGVIDVPQDQWYHDDMQKAVMMGTIKLDRTMRPNDNITREEAFTILGRALMMEGGASDELAKFSDSSQVANWAALSMGFMIKAGYIQGNNNRLAPKENMTRAELAVILYNVIKGYISKPGTFTEVLFGNIMVNADGATLKNLIINGDLILGDGVDEGTLTLDNVVIKGNTIIRSGEVVIVIPGSLPSGSGGGGGGGGGGGTSYVTGVTLDHKILILATGTAVGITGKAASAGVLNATVNGVGAYDSTVTWASSNPDIVTVDVSGNVIAVSFGTADITATSTMGGKIGKSTITVARHVYDVPTLEDALLIAENGDTILMEANKYTLNDFLTIKKSITILGPQANVDPRPKSTNEGTIRINGSDEAVLTGDNGNLENPSSKEAAITKGWKESIFKIEANNVTINGLIFERTYNHIINVTKDNIEGLKIVNNIVRQGRGNEGIKIPKTINALVQYNYIQDIGFPGDAIEADGVDGVRILDNEIYGCQSENGTINVTNGYDYSTVIIEGNLIEKTGYHFAINVHDGKGFVKIHNNKILDAAAGGIFIYKNSVGLESADPQISITDNIINSYATSPVVGTDYKIKYLNNDASAIAVSYNYSGTRIQPSINIKNNTISNGGSNSYGLCFGGGTDGGPATDLSKITISETKGDLIFSSPKSIKYINVEGARFTSW